MYKVMLVDDDYPVLEFLRDEIPWQSLGLELGSLHEDPLSALEHAEREQPDILLTDIGMPHMDGLELIRELKRLKPNLRAAILSCHSEFDYARQAMRLNVEDYLLKETLNPTDLNRLLIRFRESLDQERMMNDEQNKFRRIYDHSKELIKEKFIRVTIQQPIMDPLRWKQEAAAHGIDPEHRILVPVALFVDDYQRVRQRFVTDETLRFAVGNIAEEQSSQLEPQPVYFPYQAKLNFFICSFRDGFLQNVYDAAAEGIRSIRNAIQRSIKVPHSALIGKACTEPNELRRELNRLLTSRGQRFYMPDNSVELCSDTPVEGKDSTELFAKYDAASIDFQQMIGNPDADRMERTVRQWIAYLRSNPQPPDTVKEWILKLLLDFRLKFQSFYRMPISSKHLHHEISEIDTLSELETWLMNYFHMILPTIRDMYKQGGRPEVLEARQYVLNHLDQRIGLEEISAYLHLNPSYFSRLFRRETGETFIEFVTRMKIARAKELLDQTTYSVGKIGEMLGYDNQSYFIKTFKSLAGVTPAEYREMK